MVRAEVLEVGIEVLLRQGLVQKHFVEVLQPQKMHHPTAAYRQLLHRAQETGLLRNVLIVGRDARFRAIAIKVQVQLESLEDDGK